MTTLKNILVSIGIDDDIADIYIALSKFGQQSISQLTKNSGIERTKIYRLLPKLQKANLVELIIEQHRTLLVATPIDNLEDLVTNQIKRLKRSKSKLKDVIASDLNQHKIHTNIRFFFGVDGVKQMLWNQTKSTTEVVSVLSDNIKTHTGKEFFNNWSSKCNDKNMIFRSVVDQHFIEKQLEWYGGMFGTSLANWQGKVLQEQDLTIDCCITIYDDIATFFSWEDGDIFGIEIHNSLIASMQKQYFELLWKIASPIDTHIHSVLRQNY